MSLLFSGGQAEVPSLGSILSALCELSPALVGAPCHSGAEAISIFHGCKVLGPSLAQVPLFLLRCHLGHLRLRLILPLLDGFCYFL